MKREYKGGYYIGNEKGEICGYESCEGEEATSCPHKAKERFPHKLRKYPTLSHYRQILSSSCKGKIYFLKMVSNSAQVQGIFPNFARLIHHYYTSS